MCYFPKHILKSLAQVHDFRQKVFVDNTEKMKNSKIYYNYKKIGAI